MFTDITIAICLCLLWPVLSPSKADIRFYSKQLAVIFEESRGGDSPTIFTDGAVTSAIHSRIKSWVTKIRYSRQPKYHFISHTFLPKLTTQEDDTDFAIAIGDHSVDFGIVMSQKRMLWRHFALVSHGLNYQSVVFTAVVNLNTISWLSNRV